MGEYLPSAPVVPDAGRWKPVFRAYPEDYDILTEHGWVNLQDLIGTPASGVVPAGVGQPAPFQGNGRATPTYGVKDSTWERYTVTESFPRVATMNPVDGAIFFVRPTHVVRGLYDGRLVRFKLKGVEFMTTAFADLWLKQKYARMWKFALADDVVRNTHSSANYFLVNKFAAGVDPVTGEVSEGKHYGNNRAHSQNSDLVDMYGEFNPEGYLGVETRLPGAGGVDVIGRSSSLSGLITAPITIFPKKHVRRERIWDHYNYSTVDPITGKTVVADYDRNDVGVFNVIVPPYHNLIIRKSKLDPNPRVPWVGGPVVVGDALDKSEIRIQNIKGLQAGGSYSPFRPDWRSISAEKLKEKE